MQKEKWQSIVGNIKDNFAVEDEGAEHLEDEGGVDIEYIVFESPVGRVRLEYIEKPVVLDKKTMYSNRVGSETRVDYVYSENEKSQKMTAYKWNEDNEEWEEMDADKFM